MRLIMQTTRQMVIKACDEKGYQLTSRYQVITRTSVMTVLNEGRKNVITRTRARARVRQSFGFFFSRSKGVSHKLKKSAQDFQAEESCVKCQRSSVNPRTECDAQWSHFFFALCLRGIRSWRVDWNRKLMASGYGMNTAWRASSQEYYWCCAYVWFLLYERIEVCRTLLIAF